MSRDSTNRFSDRVEDYIRYRPGYPPQVISFLHGALGVDPASTVADIGSGTGIFSRMLLEAGHTVFGVEPNGPMREAAERLLSDYPRFVSIPGTAEQTTLDDASVDLVCAAQAYHWFDVPRARVELQRILRPGGRVVLLWNDRREGASQFAREYQELIDTFNTDLGEVDHRRITRDDAAGVAELFGAHGYEVQRFDNAQELDFDGLRGRLLSSSYIPGPGAERYEEMIEALHGLFGRHAVDGRIRIEYDTRVYYGALQG